MVLEASHIQANTLAKTKPHKSSVAPVTGVASFYCCLCSELDLGWQFVFPLDGQDGGEDRRYTFEHDFPDGTLCLATLTP